MTSQAELAVVLRARDRYRKEFKGLQNSVNQSTKAINQLRNVAAAFGVTMGTAGVMRIVKGAISVFADFEQSLARAGAISGASTAQMVQMERAAREMGRTTQFSATQAAEALTFLSMAGFQVKEAIAALPGVLQLAAAAQIDLGQAADIASNVLSGYGLEVQELQRVNDVLAKAFTSANTDLTQLAEAMKIAGPVASAAGIEFEETTAAIALMGNAGIQASLAGTALRGSLSRLLNPSAEAQAILRDLGITLSDAKGQMLPLVNIIGQLEAAGITAGDAMTVFGDRAGPAMLALISEGSGALKDLTAELDTAGGTAERIAEEQMDTLKGSFLELQSVSDELAIILSKNLEPTLRDNISAMTDLVLVTGDAIQSNGDLISSFEGSTREALRTIPWFAGFVDVYDKVRAKAAELREERQLAADTAKEEARVLEENLAILARVREEQAKTRAETEKRNNARKRELEELEKVRGELDMQVLRWQNQRAGVKSFQEEYRQMVDAFLEGERQREAAQKRVTEGWEDFRFTITNVGQAIREHGITTQQILEAIADANRVSISVVIDQLDALGIAANDTQAIIEAFGDGGSRAVLKLAESLGLVKKGLDDVKRASGSRTPEEIAAASAASSNAAKAQALLNEMNHLGAQIGKWNRRAREATDPELKQRFLGFAEDVRQAWERAKAEHNALPSFQTLPGQMRVVPGPMNMARPAMVHGGEVIGRPGGGGGIHIDMRGATVNGIDDMTRFVTRALKRARRLGADI